MPFAKVSDEFSPCSKLHCPQTWTEGCFWMPWPAEPLAEIRFGSEVRRYRNGIGRRTPYPAGRQTR